MSTKAIRHLTEADPHLGAFIQRAGVIRIRPDRTRTPFVSLVRAVVSQQLSGKAAGTILQRVLALFPAGRFPTPAEILRVQPDALRAAGLSRQKVAYVRDLAEKAVAGVVPTRMEIEAMRDEEIVERLTRIKGVGRWTVEMLLIFGLGRPDVLPAHDLGVRKGFALVHAQRKLPTPEQLSRFGERWKPHRTTAALYLWRAVDAERAPAGR